MNIKTYLILFMAIVVFVYAFRFKSILQKFDVTLMLYFIHLAFNYALKYAYD